MAALHAQCPFIDLVRMRPGDDPYLVRDARWGPVTSIDRAQAAPFTDDAWVYRVIGIIDERCAGLVLAGDSSAPAVVWRDGQILHVRVWQPDGPLIADVAPDGAELSVQPGIARADRADTFALLWQLCVTLVEQTGCVTFARFDDHAVDTSLDLAAARAQYGDWL